MNNSIIVGQERLAQDELAYMTSKYHSDLKTLKRIFGYLLAVSLSVPLILLLVRFIIYGWIISWFLLYVFLVALTMVCLVGLGVWISYRFNQYKLLQDIKIGLKNIEMTVILRKKYMAGNDSYHFYLDSPNKLSIEVSQHDFRFYNQGDEINIEYSPLAKIYFGYF